MTTHDHLVDDGLVTVSLTVNGSERTIAVPTHRTLLDGLRDEVGLPGTKSCCAEGECGACTVLLDGKAVNSCLVLCVEVEGHEVTTIEGLSADGLTDLQEEFLNAGAVQCGFCIPGQVVAAEYLLRTNPSPDEAEIREGLSGNLCRCAGYQRIVRAVQATAVRRGAAR
jgi:carbon-monoxide dehydrogenase small subunit